MLTIMVGETEVYDENTNEFSYSGGTRVDFEHSLVSLSKWEFRYEKPFLDKTEKTNDEILFYVSCMILSPEDSSDIVPLLSEDDLGKINAYIEANHSATTFPESKPQTSREVITSELIYYWMVAYNIPFSCETWNLNRLLTLVRICNIKNQPPQKINKAEAWRRNAELNAQRRKQLKTTG